MALTLPLRNQALLGQLLKDLYDPSSPKYRQFLKPEEFTARFAPTQAQYNAVLGFARASGLTVTGEHSNRLLVNVGGPASTVETAFSTRLRRFQARDGRRFRAPTVEPAIPASLVGTVSGVVGLDDLAVRRHHAQAQTLAGTGPLSGHSPADIRVAYNLANTTYDGSGQTLALFELDGYKVSDITKYETQFGLPAVPLQNVLVDNVTGAAGSSSGEVTLDIDLMMALAPGADKILVYEGKNTNAGVLNLFNRIAADDSASVVSTSWGLAEAEVGSSALQSEATIFQQMAAQGQSIFAAAGDSGAYDQNASTLGVDDPASQPYMTGVGGTTLSTVTAGGAWSSESVWNGGSRSAGAGGGGISVAWSIPSYQSGVVTTASKGSTTKRNVPDIAIDGDPNSGYSIYLNGGWTIYGGTSCGAPLWAAFTAIANQARGEAGLSPLGFMNPTLYTLGKGARGAVDFHDIADGTTNLYYPAVAGYDCATGWGTPNGLNLLTDLIGTGGYSVSGQITLSGSGLSGVTVSNGTASATTDASGNYTLSGLSAATYTITPSKTGYAFTPVSKSVTVSNANVSAVNFTASSSSGFSIDGQVTLNGSGLPGVTVTGGNASATTDADGNYALTGFNAGGYTVTPTKPGYSFSPTSRSVTVSSANVASIDFTATANTYSISGSVTQAGSGLAGVILSTDAVSATTGGAGTYTLPSLPAGTYTVTPSKSGYVFSPSSRTVTIGAANVTGIGFTATPAAGYSISGQITLGGSALSGITVGAGAASATTDASGNYTLSGLAAGSYTVTPTGAGYTFSPSSRSVTVSAANVTAISFAATANTYTISGIVSASGSRLSGVTVSTGGFSATTGAGGSYTLSGVTTGAYTVTPSKPGYTFTPTSRSVTVSAANVTGISFTATAAAGFSVSGQITSGGSGLAGVTVATDGANTTTDAGGNYSLTGLAAGSHTLTPSKAGYAFSPTARTVTVASSNVIGIGFTAASNTLAITGQITLNGSGLPGVLVTAGAASATTNAGGSYVLSGLTAGTYTVSPSLPGYTFSPAGKSVTLSGTNASGVGFTASVGLRLQSFTLGADSVRGGNSVTGKVRFNRKLTKPVAVTITSSGKGIVPSPGKITVSKGSQTKSFTIKTKSPSAKTTVTLTATDGVTTLTATLAVHK